MNQARYTTAPEFRDYLGRVERNRDLWAAVYRKGQIPQEVRAEGEALVSRPLHLLALSEDWCGDAVNTLPLVARFAEVISHLHFRVLGRDDNPDLMDGHLTEGVSRSIPVVILYDGSFRELGWWGPRPGPLQRWVRREGIHLPPEERYREVRRWYARDRGLTTLRELLELIRAGAEGGRDPAAGGDPGTQVAVS